jgi:hypothetical protein
LAFAGETVVLWRELSGEQPPLDPLRHQGVFAQPMFLVFIFDLELAFDPTY